MAASLGTEEVVSTPRSCIPRDKGASLEAASQRLDHHCCSWRWNHWYKEDKSWGSQALHLNCMFCDKRTGFCSSLARFWFSSNTSRNLAQQSICGSYDNKSYVPAFQQLTCFSTQPFLACPVDENEGNGNLWGKGKANIYWWFQTVLEIKRKQREKTHVFPFWIL